MENHGQRTEKTATKNVRPTTAPAINVHRVAQWKKGLRTQTITVVFPVEGKIPPTRVFLQLTDTSTHLHESTSSGYSSLRGTRRGLYYGGVRNRCINLPDNLLPVFTVKGLPVIAATNHAPQSNNTPDLLFPRRPPNNHPPAGRRDGGWYQQECQPHSIIQEPQLLCKRLSALH